MDITFFVPELLREFKEVPSYAIAQFKSYLDSCGFNPKIIIERCDDNKFDDASGDRLVASSVRRVRDSFAEGSTRVILISAWYYNLPFALEFIKEYRKSDDAAIIILGGYAATYSTETIFNILGDDVDFLIRGNGYIAMHKLLDHIAAEESKISRSPVSRHSLRGGRISIPGVSYLACDGGAHPGQEDIASDAYVDNGMSERIGIDKLPVPDYSFAHEKKIKKLYLKTSDGCKYNDCSFCTSEKFNEYDEKRVSTVEKEIREYKDKYDTEFLVVVDNTFLCDRKRAKELGAIFRKYGYAWSCYSRIEIDDSLISEMIEDGCRGMFFGYDTPDEKNFLANNKSRIPFSDYRDKSKEIFRKVSELGKENPEFHADFAVIDFKWNKGLAHNDKKNGVKIHASKLQYLPGTRYYEEHPERFNFDENENFFYSRYVDFFRNPARNHTRNNTRNTVKKSKS